jgi:tetratricopeptide (TPR) repeat protein
MIKRNIPYIIFILIFFNCLFAGSEKSSQYVTEAWEHWEENNQEMVEQKFLEAIKEDKNNTRAFIGLSYLYQLQQKNTKAWKTFRHVVETEPNFYPYIFSGMMTPKMVFTIQKNEPDIIDLFKDLSKNCPVSDLKASVNGILGKYYLEHSDPDKAVEYYNKNNAITDWLLIGPFDNTSASGFDKKYAPEQEINIEKTYEGQRGIPVKWFKVDKIRHDNWIDILRYFSNQNAVFYGNTFIHSEIKQTVQIRLGTSGALKAFLNDELIIEYFDENNNDVDTYIIETDLQKGWNRLLIKCSYSEITQCNFYARITDLQGSHLTGLKVSSEIKSYTSNPGAQVKIVPNFAEIYFQEQIEKNPDHPENYLLLADCYLRNDKAIEAELILKEAIERSPDNALLHSHLLEAFLRGEKYDEISTTNQKIYSLDPNIPTIVSDKFNKYLENKNYTKAKEMLDHLETLIPESATLYTLIILYYSKREMTEKIIEYAYEAYEKFPDIWDIVHTRALLSTHITQGYKEAIKIVEAFQKKHTSADVFYTLGNFYLNDSDLKNYEKIYKKLFQYYPASTGYYFQMSKLYYATQDYKQALTYTQKAIDLCPTCAAYWASQAEIQRSMNDIPGTIQSYEKALTYMPTYYDARDNLNELQGKPSVYSHFTSLNIDSLIDNAPTAEDYPDDSAIFLSDDLNRVVYEGGVSESREEIVIKVFNDDGIDAFKEYGISYNQYTEELIVERAVTIKQDKSEIDADINEGYVVFKSLEENDVIYLKWKVRNYYSGKLSNHFWDTFNFNLYYPMKIVKYSILAPENHTFNVKAQNMSDKPALQKKTDDGILFEWIIKDEPGIKGEYHMQGLEDIGKLLYISSIPDWKYLVNWYSDLSDTKTRSSYEIKEQIENLFGQNETISETEKIETIYHYITENIRYSNISFRQSRLIPQKARDVLVNKIGDCKDMAALAIAMLKEAGIDAFYVLVNTIDEGINKNILPSIAFNHTIVGVNTSNGILYLDLTAQHYPVGSVPRSDLDAFALAIKSGSSGPFYLTASHFKESNKSRIAEIRVHDDNSILSHLKTIRTGRQSAYFRSNYRFLSEKEKKKKLTETLAQSYANVELIDFEINNIDSLSHTLEYRYKFKAPDFINQAGDLKIIKLPWTDNFEPIKALSYETRIFPYCYWPTADTIREDITMHLPAGYKPVQLDNELKYSCDAAEYTLSLSFKNNILSGTRVLINKMSNISPELYADFKKFYNNVVQADKNQIILKKN